MRKDYRFSVTLKLVAPVITQGLEGKLLGIDTSAWQVEDDGKFFPALPSSLIQGNLRHAWKRLEKLAGDAFMSSASINEWLGGEAQEDSFNKPVRARLRSSDFWRADLEADPEMRFRITIDPDTGAVKRGHVQVIESPYPAGTRVAYSGWFEVSATEEEAAELRSRILQGLQFVPALGAFKSIGFGRIEAVEVSAAQERKQDSLTPQSGDSFGLVLELDRPICFARPHADDNRFESESHIPGAALIGAVINRMQQLSRETNRWPVLRKHIDAIRFTHAFPAEYGKQQRGVPIPLSLFADEQAVHDAASAPMSALAGAKAPVFQPDWKSEWSDVEPVFSGLRDGNEPHRQLRVRTAIETESQAAADEKLFAQEVVETHKHQWLANASLYGIPDGERSAVGAELLDLLGYGLHGLGKTRAMTSRIQSTTEIPPVIASQTNTASLQVGQTLRLLLVTPARLLPDRVSLPATNGGGQLHQIYADSWETLSGGSLKLKHFFARQQLYGGDYYYHRFLKPLGNTPYNPLLLTEAGSVFVLEVTDPAGAVACLQQWQQAGLPQLPGITGAEDWHSNPLLAANGYGEILLEPAIPSLPLTQKEARAHV
ncbi:RAMP superfamily CRISPR-associated protein [Thiothrix eikelboomii]|uniref:RAMP superfamily CRISPR-associated protein n=1 Tax=Thiothrix eikelboomii TaxID=92487 RepID=UPI003BAEA3A2